jgi:transposase
MNAAASSPRSSRTSTAGASSKCSTAAGFERYPRSVPERHRAAIEVVSIDPYEAYRQSSATGCRGPGSWSTPFHLVRGANTALDSVRRERQIETGRPRANGARSSGKGAS